VRRIGPPLVGRGSVRFMERYARGNDMPAYVGDGDEESNPLVAAYRSYTYPVLSAAQRGNETMARDALILLTSVVVVTSSAPRFVHADPFLVLLPDLVVSDLKVTNTRFYIKTVTVTVKEICQVDAPASFVQLRFGDGVANIGNSGPPLKKGKSYSQTFDVSYLKIVAGGHIRATINPTGAVVEDTRDNNWLAINPNAGPFPVSGATHCTPKPYFFVWFPLPGK
jgi:hypothetical protein